MTAWKSNELTKIGAAEELRIASMRRNDTLSKPVIVWVVHHGDDLYVRSVSGRTAAWFCGVQVRHEGHIWAGGIEKDVTFVDVGDEVNDQVDDAYRTKYRHYESIVPHIINAQARSATIKLVPR